MKIWGFHDGHACGFDRVLLPLDALWGLGGHQIGTSCGWNEKCKEFDIIIGQRVGKTDALPLWRRLAATHKLVYELDDDVWSIDRTNLSAVIAHTPALLADMEHAASVAHMVQVTTEPLAEVMRQFNDNVVVLPNHFPGRMLEITRPRRERLTIGWSGGDSHYRDIGLIVKPLKRILRQYPQTEFHNIGSDFTKVFGIPGRAAGWIANKMELYQTIDFDIGLAPVDTIKFNRSKSGLKALEYMALGIPVIASDFDPYQPIVVDGVTGFLVRHEHEWFKRMRELVNDHDMREEMGRNAREHSKKWAIENGWRMYEEAYLNLLGAKTYARTA